MPKRRQKGQHTAKAERMAKHIEDSAREDNRYRGREKEVAWRKVHKELSHAESHKKTGRRSSK